MQTKLLKNMLILIAALLSSFSYSETRTIVDASGTKVEIPVSPKKIVAISEIDLDAMIALGVKPFGTLKGRGQDTATRYLGSKVDGVQILGDFYRPNVDLLLEAEPDLILAGGVPIPPVMNILKNIAPTVVTYNLGDDWKTSFKQISEVLNKQESYADFMEGYETRASEVKTKLSNQDLKTISIIRWNPKGPAYMSDDAFAIKVIEDLGLNKPRAQSHKGIAHSDTLSLEALHLLEADYMLLGTLSTTGEAAEALKEAKNNPAYQQLNVVKNNQVKTVDGSLFTSMGGPLGALSIIDFIEKELLD